MFVDQATSDICHYFKDYMPGYEGENLKAVLLPGVSLMAQSVNDLLLANKMYEHCLKDTLCPSTAFFFKIQLCQQEIKYSGFMLTEGQR